MPTGVMRWKKGVLVTDAPDVQNGKLSIAHEGQGTWELLPEAEDRFFSLTAGIPPIRFIKNAEGAVIEIRGRRRDGEKSPLSVARQRPRDRHEE